tara:strand:- start:73 stop:327 length:255 start_codon:yes stop_codon:yes gene_type:complete
MSPSIPFFFLNYSSQNSFIKKHFEKIDNNTPSNDSITPSNNLIIPSNDSIIISNNTYSNTIRETDETKLLINASKYINDYNPFE